MNGRIDYSNLQNITKQLKSSITKKYETFEKITAEVSSSVGSSGGTGGGGGGMGDLGDLLNIFFTQGTYNGTLKINGGLIVDYIETDDTGEAGDIDKTAVNKLIDRAIRSNNKRLAGVGGPGAAGSVGSLSGVGISSASIRNSFFSGGTIDGATVENLDGLNNLFKDDYLDMYSIASVRDNFIIYVSSAYNDVRFTYDDKERDYYTLSFGQQKDIFTNQDFVLSNQNIANTYINSKVYNVLFEPGNLPIGITGLTQTIEEQRAKFKISDMNVEIGKSSDTTASPIMTINGDLRVMSGGRIFLDTREIKPTGGSGAIFSIPEDGITRSGVITKINVDNGGSGYDPGSANIIFGAPRFATRDVFSSEGNQQGMVGNFPAQENDSLTIEITDGVITAVTITGSNTTVYPGPPNITITGSGSGAVITADMSANRWQSPEQAVITGFTIENGGSGYTGSTQVSVASSPEVITAELEQGSLVVVNGVITSVQLPENGIGSFYMRGTNTIIMNTTDTASSQTLTDLFGESISLTNDSLTDLQIKYISDTVNQTTLSSISSNNKTLYDGLNIKGGMIVASNVAIIQNIRFKIRTEDNILTHIAPINVEDSLVLNSYSVPETRRVTLKNWFDEFKVFQRTVNGDIETQLQKISLTSIVANDTSPLPHPTIGSAADGDAIGTFQGVIEIDIVVGEQVSEFQKIHGFPSQLVSGTNISGDESNGNPIFIGENDSDIDVNLKLPIDSVTENPVPLHFFGTYQLHNSATGSLEFITDGSTDIISRNNTFFSGNTNKIIMGYNSADAPTLNNNELLHVNGIIKADSIENTAIGLNTASSGRFSTLTVNGASTIHGDLTVHGTQTTINSTTLTVDDINIEMGSVSTPTDVTADGGGIILKGTTDKSILWSSANFTSSENFNLASSKVFKIATNDVLSSTTLGSGVTISSLEQVAVLNSGSISTGFGNIDNGESNITTGGLLKIDVDADADDTTADSAKGRLSLGLSQDLNIYHGGTNSYIVNNTGNLVLHTSDDLSGFIFDSKGGSVVIKENGVTMTTINNSGINIVSGDEYKINNQSVLSHTTLGAGVVNSSLTQVGALDDGSITSNFGDIDIGTSNITTGGLLRIDLDADANDSTADSLTGRLILGASGDINIYHGGTDSFIVNKTGNLELHTQESEKGFILDAKNGTVEIKEDGTLVTTINNTGINIVSGDEYQIDGNSVLSANTLGTGVLTSSLTTVAALDSGSITSNFGNIDNGDSNITTGGVLHIDKDADANDTTADSTNGMLSIGIDSDLNLYHGGVDSFLVNKTGNLELHTQEASKGFILDAKNGTVEIKEDGTLVTTINNTGINIVSGDEYQIDGNSVLSADTLGTGVVTSSLTTVAALDSGSITSNFGNIDNGDSNITTGGVLHIDKDADANDTTADSTNGMLSMGANSDLNLYHGGVDSFLVNKTGNLELYTQEASKGFVLDAKNGTVEIKEDGTLVTTINNTGINIVSGDEYQINGNSVLSADTLGTGVVTSSLTTVAALDSGSISSNFGNIDNGDSNVTTGGVLHIDKDADANDTTADSTNGMLSIGVDSDLNLYHGGVDSFLVNKTGNLELHTQEASKGFILDAKNGTVEIKEDGTLVTTINNTGINIVSGDEYQIDGNSVLSADTLGTGVVTSSLTTVAALDSGSITSNFGNIDNGDSNITTGGVLHIDKDADSNDTTADSTNGMLSIGVDSDLNLYHGGVDSFVVNKTGNLELHTQEASKGFILDAKNGTVEIKEDGTLVTTINNTGINIVSGDEYQIDGNSVLSADTLGTGVVTSSLTTVAALDSGSITSNFGNIDNGDSNITTGGVLHIDKDTDANDNTADSATGMISLGIDSDLNLYHGGVDSFLVNKTGNLELHTQEASKGFILDAKNGTVEIKEDGTLVTTINNTGINIVSGDEYQIDGNSVLSADTLGTGVVTSSLTTVAALDSGSITSNFGDIDIGTNTLKSQDILVTNAGIGVTTASAALDIQDIFTDKSNVNTIVKITSTTDDNTADIGFGGRISLNGENGGDPTNGGSIQEAVTIDYYLKERDQDDSDATVTDTSADIWALNFRIKDDEQMVDALTIVGAGGGPDGDNSVAHGANVGIGTTNPTNRLDIDGTLRATGATSLSSSLSVTGATTLASSLSVSGAATLADTLSVAGHTELTSTMTIKGAHDVVLKLEADTGNPNTTESEDWNPLIHLSQDKGATNTYFGLVGNSNTGMNPSVANYAYINSNQGIHLGRNGVPSLTVGNNSNVHIGGSNNVTEKLRVTGTFNATDDSTIGGTLDVTGATTIGSTLSISGKYYGDGSKLTSLNTNLIKNDNSSVDVLTRTAGNPISFDGVTTNTVYDERTSSGNIVSYSFRFKMTDATQTAYLFSSPTGTGGDKSNSRFVKIYNSGASIVLSDSDQTTDGGGNVNTDGTQYFQDDTLHHIVISAQTEFSGPSTTDYKIYVDGVHKFTQSEDANLDSPFTDFQTKFKLGIGHFGSDGHLDGEIQELYIFNSTITDSEATSLYNYILPFSLNNSLVHSLATTSSEFIKFKNESSETMRITNNKVGIGTNSPSFKLDVSGTARITGTLKVTKTDSSYNVLQGHLQVGDNLNNAHFRLGSITSSSGTLAPLALLRSSDANNPSLIINYGSQFPSGTKIDSDLRVTGDTIQVGNLILQNSKLGIGTTSPTEKLEVNGNIKATTVEANLTGNVTGNITGNLTGDVTGDLTGDVTGDVTGDLTGNVTGNVVGDINGDVTGDVIGNLTGDVNGSLTGDVTGNVTGDLTGNVTGDLTGNVTGDLTGNVTGDLTGNVIGNIVGDVTGDVTGDVIGNLKGDVNGLLTGNVIGDVNGDVTGNLTGNVTGDVTGDLSGNVTGDLTGSVNGNVIGDVTGNVTGDLIGDVTGNVTGTLIGDVESGEWKGKAISNTKLAVSEAIKSLSVLELNDEPGDEINEDSDEALGTDTTTTAASKEWRKQTHNKLRKAERNVESLRNTVESLVLAMNQMIRAFE